MQLKQKLENFHQKEEWLFNKIRKMIMSDSASSVQQASSDTDFFTLCTNSTEMVENIFTLCSFLWNASKPLKTIDVKNFVKKSRAA